MRVMRAWHICPKYGTAFGAAAKCGSTMLADLIQRNVAHRLPVADARHGRECWSVIPQSYRRVMIVRDPVSRFESLLTNIRERKRDPNNYFSQFEGLDPAETLAAMLENGLDHDFHTQPQVRIKPPGDVILVRLEAFADWWKASYPDEQQPKRLNESKSVGRLSPFVADLVESAYAADMDLYLQAVSAADAAEAASAAG